METAERKKQMKEYREAFLLFDKDEDGTITTSELETVMRSLCYSPTQAQLKAMIAEVDSDGNGVIEFDEFVTMLDNFGGMVALDSRERDMRAAFSVFDKDGDGFITAVELRDTLSSLGQEISIQELKEMMAEADGDGDGRIDYTEFARVMVKNNIF